MKSVTLDSMEYYKEINRMKKIKSIKGIKDVFKERMDTRLKNMYSVIVICLSYKYHGYFVAGNS